jgi:hypothetical protein
MAETWDEEKPAGSRKPSLGDDDIRELKRALRERLAEDHQFEGAEDPAFGAAGGYQVGKHNFVTLLEQASDKVTLENEVAMEAKDLSGSPEVYLVPENAGTPLLITRGNISKLNAITANNGTYDIAFPTNNMAAAIYMLGNSDTIVWMYLNVAPPSWKALATGGDMVLGIAGGSGAYSVEGGNPDSAALWAISGLSVPAGGSHNHQWYFYDGNAGDHDQLYDVAGNLISVGNHAKTTGRHIDTNINPGTAPLDAYTKKIAHSHPSVDSDGGWRPAASVGKLFQLDTA